MVVFYTDNGKEYIRGTQVFELSGSPGNLVLKILDGDPITLYGNMFFGVRDIFERGSVNEELNLNFTTRSPVSEISDDGRSMKEKAISWFKKLTRNQANMLMLRSTKLFNDLFDGTLDALAEYTDSYLQTMIDTVTSSFPEKSDRKPAWDFVHKFMIWYEGQDTRRLPDGYAVIWNHAEARDYASLFDIGQEMLTTAIQAAENSK